MRRRADATRSKVDLARIGFCIGDKLGNVVGRHRRMHHHYIGQPNQSSHRSAVANEIERKLLVERRVDGVVRTDEGDRVAIGYRAEHRLHADIAARAGPVLDDELLPQMIRQILADNARDDVVGAARRKRDDPVYRPRRISFRPRDPRDGRQRGSARGQMQEGAAGQVRLRRVYVFAPPGSRTVNTEPLPISLATVTSPPIRRASLRVMARPSPVPPKRCAVVASAWLNSSNSLACCSAVMPMPVSATASSIQSRPSATLRARSVTSPSLVNLKALLNRLSSICRSRMGSTVRVPRLSCASTSRRFWFCSASWRAVPITSSISGA